MAINLETHKPVPVRMSIEMYEKIKALSIKNHRSVSAEICVIIEKELERADN